MHTVVLKANACPVRLGCKRGPILIDTCSIVFYFVKMDNWQLLEIEIGHDSESYQGRFLLSIKALISSPSCENRI